MHIEIKRYSGIPLAKQVVQTITDRIESGLLKEGDKLPSVRQLASTLQVSQVTVSKAYSQLEQRGFIECVQGRGSFVYREKSANSLNQEKINSSTAWQLETIDYLSRAQMWRQYHAGIMNGTYTFDSAIVHKKLLPSEEISKEFIRELQQAPDMLVNYAPAQGDLQFRTALAKSFKEQDPNITCDDILVINGAQQGIDLVARTFIGPGDIVYLEAPTYTGAIDIFLSRGAKVLSVPADEEGMRVDILTKMSDKFPPKLIYTNPTFHNPTGNVMSTRRRIELLELAESYHSLILEDDPFRDIYFAQSPPPTIKSLDEHGSVIYIKSFSKMLSPSFRLAALSASGTLLPRLIAAKTISDLGSSLLPQKAILAYMVSGRLNKHLKKLNHTLQARRDTALELLQQYAPAEISWTKPQGGLSIWITFPVWVNTNDLLLEAQKQQITFLPGSITYAVQPEYHHLRLSFSNIEEQDLRKGIIILCQIMKQFLAQKKTAVNCKMKCNT
jgi:DNA-binding transcriptional MocR family regulator